MQYLPTSSATAKDTPIPELADLPTTKNDTTATVLDISLPYARSLTTAEIPAINTQDCPETAEPNPRGAVATDV